MALPFTPASDDAAVEYLREIFGSVIDTIVPPAVGATQTGESAAMLAEAFRSFNSGVLLFGSLILLYVTVFSVVNTANDGVALGKKWNTFYTPFRTVIAAGSLIPGANGYAMVQWAMLFIVCQSIGFASTMWTKVVEHATSQTIVERAQRSITDDPNFDSIITNALRMRMCAYGVNKAITAVLGTDNSAAASTALTLKQETKNLTNRKWFSEDTTVDEITISYQSANWPGSDTICGKMTLTNTMSKIKQSGNDAVSADIKTNLRSSIEKVRNRYVTGLFGDKLNPVVESLVAAAEAPDKTVSVSDVRSQLNEIRTAMMGEISTAVASELTSSNTDLVKNLTGKGWIFAGSYARELARIKDAIRTSTASRSEYTAGDENALDLRLSGDVLKAVKGSMSSYTGLTDQVVQKVLASPSASTSRPTMPTIQTSFSQSDFLLGGEGVKSTFSKYFTNLGDTVVTGVIYYMEADDDPVMRVKNVGDWMAVTAETLLLVKAVTVPVLTGLEKGLASSAVPGTAAMTGIVAGVLSYLVETWNSLMPSVYTILYGGYFLGIWLPMVPFYIFGIGVAGWMIYVVEMCAAGVLWAAAHTTPTREDSFIGSQTQGYLLVMSGFFRPALMILGLVASQAVMNPIVRYINEAFVANFRSVQATSTTGLMSIAGYILVYCFIMAAAFMLTYSLPQSLPDRILRWIGAGIQDIGEQNTAGRVESGASGQSRNAALAAASKQAAFARARDDKNKQRRSNSIRDGEQEALKANAIEGHAGQSTVTDGPVL
jgi:conjugal transfer/type IV secretion protein DotA/TraY